MPADNRLVKIAGMVRQGDRVADIGSDHAHLPIFLVENGISPFVLACDIADGPLGNARTNIDKSGVKGIETRKSDGLAAVAPTDADTVIIAGMGGDLIARIITDAPWIKNSRYELILQPMTSAEDLRAFLLKNGFEIAAEKAVSSQRRIYTVMKAVYTGKIAECSPLLYYIGRLSDNPGEEEIIYIKRKRRILAALAEDVKSIENRREKYKMLLQVLDGIDRLLGDKNGN